MKLIKRDHIACPACKTTDLEIAALHCKACDICIQAKIKENEFAKLSSEDLHFLRVFIHCDGKVKDVEKALGISYPSVKSKLEKLKVALEKTANQELSINQILEKIDRGELDYESGLSMIKKIKERGN